jgi:hypothetical protein
VVAWRAGRSVSTTAEWFSKRFARARRLIPDAAFDTIIGTDFDETVTAEIVDLAGVAGADPVDGYSAGVIDVHVGGPDVQPSHARLQLTGSPSHVGPGVSSRSWYIASLVRLIRPSDDDMANTGPVDAIGLWSNDSDHIGLGLFGNGSGGSSTNWIGYADDDGSITTVLGPALDGEESPVWHLFEAWFDVGAGELSFAIDEEEFDDTIDVAAMPDLAMRLSMISNVDLVDIVVASNYDKACVVVAAPRVGEID